jgi:hypothetical protein
MELTVPLITLPAIVALFVKAAIYVYTRLFHMVWNAETKLFVVLLCALVAQNLAEIVIICGVNGSHWIPHYAGRLYFTAATIALAVFFHLACCLAFDETQSTRRYVPGAVYGWAAALVVLVYTPWLIAGFEKFDYHIGLSATRIPGPLYPVFEAYVIGVCVGALGISVYGWRSHRDPRRRSQNLVLLTAFLPTFVVVVAVIALLHLGIKWFNATVTAPITLTYFLVVSAYAIHSRRFFDIQPGLNVLTALRAQSLRAHKGTTLEEEVAALEAKLISQALELCAGNQAQAAGMLGLRPNTLYYKMEKYGLRHRKRRG